MNTEKVIKWKANGEANSFVILQNNHWLAGVQLNGVFLQQQQQDIMNRLVSGLATQELLAEALQDAISNAQPLHRPLGDLEKFGNLYPDWVVNGSKLLHDIAETSWRQE